MIYKYSDFRSEVLDYRNNGLPTGYSTGWDEVDKHFRPQLGMMVVLTGIPGHGKSEFWDCYMANTVWLHEWRWCVFSPENYPLAIHFNKLAEKFLGCSQKDASDADYKMATQMIDEYFTWLYPPDDGCTLDEILENVKKVKDTFGCNAFVLDPWNEISHLRPPAMTETEYISQSLTRFRRFCRAENLLGCIVAHPTKTSPDKDGKIRINLWSISGSAAWRNKADFGLVVVREDMSKNEPVLQVQKVKQKNYGKIGDVPMMYDVASGRMKDSPLKKYGMPKRG